MSKPEYLKIDNVFYVQRDYLEPSLKKQINDLLSEVGKNQDDIKLLIRAIMNYTDNSSQTFEKMDKLSNQIKGTRNLKQKNILKILKKYYGLVDSEKISTFRGKLFEKIIENELSELKQKKIFGAGIATVDNEVEFYQKLKNSSLEYVEYACKEKERLKMEFQLELLKKNGKSDACEIEEIRHKSEKTDKPVRATCDVIFKNESTTYLTEIKIRPNNYDCHVLSTMLEFEKYLREKEVAVKLVCFSNWSDKNLVNHTGCSEKCLDTKMKASGLSVDEKFILWDLTDLYKALNCLA